MRQAQAALPAEWSSAEILVASSHNHHGPETAFGPNGDWYQMAVEQIVDAVVAAVAAIEPASVSLATGVHDYGSVDQRDPRIYDNRLNVMAFNSEYRLQCHALSLSALPGTSCQDLADRGIIESPDWIGGIKCQQVTDDPLYLESLAADGPAVQAICYYGQMVGAQIEEPPGHCEETNSAGWDLVDDLWDATVRLFEQP